jgi:hypothetical protein
VVEGAQAAKMERYVAGRQVVVVDVEVSVQNLSILQGGDVSGRALPL